MSTTALLHDISPSPYTLKSLWLLTLQMLQLDMHDGSLLLLKCLKC